MYAEAIKAKVGSLSFKFALKFYIIESVLVVV